MKKLINNFWIWNTEELTEALRKNLPINEGLYGLFLFLSFVVSPMFVRSNGKVNYGNHSYYVALEMLIGFIFIYYVNRKYGNKDFLKKIICLFLPISLRFILISVIMLTIFKIFSISSEVKYNYVLVSDHLWNLIAFLYLRYLIIKSSIEN